MDGGGSNVTRLTTSGARQPRSSPDGRTVVFAASAEKKPLQIFVMNSDGSNVRMLTNSEIASAEPSWTFDGNKIAFTKYVHVKMRVRANIFQMNSDGSNTRRLTAGPVGDQRPSFSPDGSKLAFHSNRDGNYEIYVRQLQ
jgi:Tol biopolymer transport system component